MRLTQFKRQSPTVMLMVWDDGHSGAVSLRRLRDACPCAGCQGESVLLESYAPPLQDKERAGRYELTSAAPVGNYAIQFRWADGHGEGIYNWETLRGLCECPVCTPAGDIHPGSDNGR